MCVCVRVRLHLYDDQRLIWSLLLLSALVYFEIWTLTELGALWLTSEILESACLHPHPKHWNYKCTPPT